MSWRWTRRRPSSELVEPPSVAVEVAETTEADHPATLVQTDMEVADEVATVDVMVAGQTVAVWVDALVVEAGKFISLRHEQANT